MIQQDFDQPTEQELALARERKAKADAAQAAIQAERNRIYAEREARLKAEREGKIVQVITDDPAKRAATLLRGRLGDDLGAFVHELGRADFVKFREAITSILHEEEGVRRIVEMQEITRQSRAAGWRPSS